MRMRIMSPLFTPRAQPQNRPLRPIRRLIPAGPVRPPTGDAGAGVAVAGTVKVRPAWQRLSLHLQGLRRHLKRYNSAV